MAKLTRKTAKIFGETASATGDANIGPYIGQFGSAKVGTYLGTTDIATIQALPAWSNGWVDAVTPTHQFPTLPEMTGVHKVLSYQEAYLLQQGIPEWDANTTYYADGFCSFQGIIYKSLVDDNLNNQPNENPIYWFEYGSGNYANQDLTNLTQFGNARLQYVPFAINNGAVDNGENVTLTGDGGGSYIIEDANFNFTNGTNTFSGVRTTQTLIPANPELTWTKLTANLSYYSGVYNPLTTLIITVNYTDGTSEDVVRNPGAIGNGTSATQYRTYTLDLNTSKTIQSIYCQTNYTPQTANQNWPSCTIRFTGNYQVGTYGSTLICNPCILTTCDGITSNAGTALFLDISEQANGDYFVFRNIESDELTLISTFTISKIEPISPSSNDYWLDISTVPANLKYYNSGWNISNNLIFIGSCSINSGEISAIKNNQFNMNGYWEFANLPNYEKTAISIGSGFTAPDDGWIVTTANAVVQPIHRGESYSNTSNKFLPMRGY